jgi:hypothetical protein
VSTSKTALVKAFDASVADLKQQVKSVTDVKKEVESKLNQARANILKPRDEWQAEQDRIEQERVSEIRNRIENIRMIGVNGASGNDKQMITDKITALESMDVSDGFAEFTQDAVRAVQSAISLLNDRLQRIIIDEREAKQRQELEAERKKNEISERLMKLKSIPMDMFGKSSSEIDKKIKSLESYSSAESEFFERAQEAEESKLAVINQLKIMLNQALQLESVNGGPQCKEADIKQLKEKAGNMAAEAESTGDNDYYDCIRGLNFHKDGFVFYANGEFHGLTLSEGEKIESVKAKLQAIISKLN